MNFPYLLTVASILSVFGALAHADIDPLYAKIYCEDSPSKLQVKGNKLTYQGQNYTVDANSFSGSFRETASFLFLNDRTNYEGQTSFVATSARGNTVSFLFTITPDYKTDGHNYVLGNVTLKNSSGQVIDELEGCTQDYGI